MSEDDNTAAKVMRLADSLKAEYGSWPTIKAVFYKSFYEGILPGDGDIESFRLIRRIALSGGRIRN